MKFSPLRKCLSQAAIAFSLLGLLSLGGCDWIHFAFMNSIPFKGNPAKNPDISIYLGVDGLSFHTVQEAMKNGALQDPSWRLAKFIPMFPATSDASWTRIMHTPKIGGYEIEYYNPEKNKVVNKGILGLAKHVMPAITEGLSFEFDYLKAFDYRANGYTHSLTAYRDTFVSLGDTLDNLFYLLDGRIQTTSVFSAYLLEYDVMGHMQACADVSRAFKMLADRMEKFRRQHPERNINFTLLSDHGMDFKRVTTDHMMRMDEELEKIGIHSVESLEGLEAGRGGLYAIPIMHTLVTYIALHTLEAQREEVAAKVSHMASVDMTIARIKTPAIDPHALDPIDWFGIYNEGKLTAYFGFDSQTNEYYLPADQNYERLDIHGLTFEAGKDFKILKDDAVFALTKTTNYPDIFYRTRTALSTVSLQYPADVLVSYKIGYASQGFTLPGSSDIASAGFHGAMNELGTAGTLLTTERELPDTVRSDNFLDLFPKMKQHMHSLGVETIQGDPNALLHY